MNGWAPAWDLSSVGCLTHDPPTMAEAFYKKELRELMALPENKSEPLRSPPSTISAHPARRMRRLWRAVPAVGECSGEAVRPGKRMSVDAS